MTHRNRKPCDSDTVVVGSKTYDQLWAESLAGHVTGRPSGEGWLTIDEVSKKKGVGFDSARGILTRGYRKGIFEKAFGNENGRKMVYYRPKIK